jgi:hypothetical protein
LTADAFEAFTEGKGPYDKAVGDRLVKYVFSVGNTIDPAEAYRMFRGRDPKVEALMRKRGFPVTHLISDAGGLTTASQSLGTPPSEDGCLSF